MAKKKTLSNELKGLGQDLSKALKKMVTSEEFKQLQKEIVRSTKSIAKSLGKSVRAAQRSPSASRLKKRLKRVVQTGKAQGKIEAQRAQVAAAQGIRKARQALQKAIKEKAAKSRYKGPGDPLGI